MTEDDLTFPMNKIEFLRALSKALSKALEYCHPMVGLEPPPVGIDYGVTHLLDQIRKIDTIIDSTRVSARNRIYLKQIQITQRLDVAIVPRPPRPPKKTVELQSEGQVKGESDATKRPGPNDPARG